MDYRGRSALGSTLEQSVADIQNVLENGLTARDFSDEVEP